MRVELSLLSVISVGTNTTANSRKHLALHNLHRKERGMRKCFDLTVNDKCPVLGSFKERRVTKGCFDGKRSCFRNPPIELYPRDNTETNKRHLNF